MYFLVPLSQLQSPKTFLSHVLHPIHIPILTGFLMRWRGYRLTALSWERGSFLEHMGYRQWALLLSPSYLKCPSTLDSDLHLGFGMKSFLLGEDCSGSFWSLVRTAVWDGLWDHWEMHGHSVWWVLACIMGLKSACDWVLECVLIEVHLSDAVEIVHFSLIDAKLQVDWLTLGDLSHEIFHVSHWGNLTVSHWDKVYTKLLKELHWVVLRKD